MKKYLLKIFVLAVLLLNVNNIYALSKEFLFTIETVGIPRYNSYGNEISEDVYLTYNIFSYSEPHKISSVNQRWKNSKYGYWAKGKGRYTGTGIRGEYYVLGYTYSGEEIINYYFPMDVIPSMSPENWSFYLYPDALSSWADTTMYQYDEQLMHMLKSKLMFNDLSSTAKANNPKYIKEYNITAEEIGKKKARLEAAATWRTHGMISTRRKISGIIYTQVYLVKPMAANAEVNVSLDVPTHNVLNEEKDELYIPIKYSVSVCNMSGYANEKHIKEIKAVVYIDGERVDEASGSKIISVGSEYMLVITRERIPPNSTRTLEILVDGYMHTEFAADGLMRETVKQTISIKVEAKKINPIKRINYAILEKQNDEMVVRPLAQNIETNNLESIGFIEAGKNLVAKLDLSVDSVEKIDVILDKKTVNHRIVYNTRNKIILAIKIPENMETTLYGESSLRDKYGSYFNVNKADIGTRKNEPYVLKIIVTHSAKEHVFEIKLDILDTFISNMNTETEVLNLEEALRKIKLDEWKDI